MKRVGKSNCRPHRDFQPARDWRMAVLGGGCTTLGAACLLLAACSAAPNKPSITAREPEPASIPVRSDSGPPASPTPAPAVQLSPWARLSSRFVLPDCDYSPD